MLLQDMGCTINYRHLSICGLCNIAQEGESVLQSKVRARACSSRRTIIKSGNFCLRNW